MLPVKVAVSAIASIHFVASVAVTALGVIGTKQRRSGIRAAVVQSIVRELAMELAVI